jgi:hypothetical protein
MSNISSPFIQLRVGSENTKSNFLFISMYTKNYGQLAERLAVSMEKHGLPFAIYEVPTVHNSISEKGSQDLTYTKSSFIRNIMSRTNKNIIYIDCDCEIKKFPSLLFEIAAKNDFAIFNWLSPQENNVYLPYHNNDNSESPYKYSHCIQATCSTQLICSGAVQFWANSQSSIKLLKYWQSTIEHNKGAADDYCLDFAFNNFHKISNISLRYYWLPKAYARYAWWIFDEPIIDHPQIPNTSTKWADVNDSMGGKRFYSEKFDARIKDEYGNKYDGIIFPKLRIHTNLNADGEINIKSLNEKLWIPRNK